MFMKLQDLVTRFLRYNLWANVRLTSWLMTLDKDILYKATGSSFGTIDRTLQHIVAAQIYWFDILVKNRINDFDLPLKEHAADEVVTDLVASSQRLVDSLSILDDEKLTELVKASDSTQSRYEYILHVVNHSSYHRGQIVSMARALGVKGEIPVTDYDGYLWWLGRQTGTMQ